jgi:TPR repeat protein
MKVRILLPIIIFSCLTPSAISAQQNVDPTHARLAIASHLASLTQHDVESLSSEARSGSPEAQYWLALVYEQGKLVPRDMAQSENLLVKSAEQGFVRSEANLGMVLKDKDRPASERWLLRAAEQGDPEAQFWLGVAYDDNWYGTTDAQLAARWFEKAAAQGHPDAQAILDQMCKEGRGVEQNYAMAAEWFRKAAEHVPDLGGAGQGRNELGLLYVDGLGVPKDYVQAYMWFTLANVKANCAYVQDQMTPAQISKAQRMVEEWKKLHPTPETPYF